MIKARIVSGVKVEVTGLDETIASKATWRAALDAMGLDLQERISDSFANERVAGNSQLKTNTTKWNRFKASHELDPRRGHASNRLQGALDGKRLFHVGAQRRGKVRIEFKPTRLHSRVFYSEFYEDKKVRRKSILVLAHTWVQEAVRIVKEVEAAATMKRSRAKRRRERRRRA